MKHGKIMCAAMMLVASAAWAQQRDTGAQRQPPRPPQAQQPGQLAAPQAAPHARPASADVMRQLQKTATSSATAINEKNYDQFIRNFTENGLLVTGDGQRHQGHRELRRAIERETTSGMLRDMRLQIDVQHARILGPDLAIVEFRQTLTPVGIGGAGMEGTGGAARQGGTAQTPMMFEGVAVAQRSGDQWKLISSHVFPSRDMLEQQRGVGGSGLDDPQRPRMTPPTPKR